MRALTALAAFLVVGVIVVALAATAFWLGAYLELFARRSRVGWTTWGNEVGTGA